MKPLNYHPDANGSEAKEIVKYFCTANNNLKRSARSLKLLDTAQRISIDTTFGPIVVWDWGADEPDKPIALLCHGWSDSAATWVAFHRPLREAGYRIVAFDQPGHGATADLTGINETIFPRMNVATAAVLEWARSQGHVGALIGHSVGALGAFMAGCDSGKDNPDRVVCIAMPPGVPWFLSHYADEIGMSEKVRQEYWMHLRYRLGEDMGHEYDEESLDSVNRAEDLQMPVLFVQDSADSEVPIEAIHRTVEAVRESSGTVESFDTEGLGHQLVLRAPVVINRVMEFLRLSDNSGKNPVIGRL